MMMQITSFAAPASTFTSTIAPKIKSGLVFHPYQRTNDGKLEPCIIKGNELARFFYPDTPPDKAPYQIQTDSDLSVDILMGNDAYSTKAFSRVSEKITQQKDSPLIPFLEKVQFSLMQQLSQIAIKIDVTPIINYPSSFGVDPKNVISVNKQAVPPTTKSQLKLILEDDEEWDKLRSTKATFIDILSKKTVSAQEVFSLLEAQMLVEEERENNPLDESTTDKLEKDYWDILHSNTIK